MELVLLKDLCGTFCFSMQFVIGMELLGTVVLPAAIVFTFVLIGTILTPSADPNSSSMLPLLTLLMVIFVPSILVVFSTGRLIYLMWLLIYLLALPIWNFVLPVYAFWHFDDFSWGKTRQVKGDTGKDDHGASQGTFDPSLIPMRRWSEWESMKRSRAVSKKKALAVSKSLPSPPPSMDMAIALPPPLPLKPLANGGQRQTPATTERAPYSATLHSLERFKPTESSPLSRQRH